MNSPLKWMGGKCNLRDTIIKFIPAHRTYVEPFGGAGWVLFGKPPSMVEVFNDLNGKLFNLWKTLQSDVDPFKVYLSEQLVFEDSFNQYLLEEGYTTQAHGGIPMAAPDGIPSGDEGGHSTGIPNAAAKQVYQPSSRGIPSLESAARYFFLVKAAWNGIVNDGATFAAHPGKNNGFLTFHNTDWSEICQRLQKVTILNRDFENLIKKYDSPTTFFYLDPPYHCTINSNKYYEFTFSESDHHRLKACLDDLEGKYILSYDNIKPIREIYHNQHIKEVPINYRKDGTELLISNFKLKTGFYRVQKPKPNNNGGGRWDNPNCPYCQSLNTRRLYQRATLPQGGRTFKASAYVCDNCQEVYQ